MLSLPGDALCGFLPMRSGPAPWHPPQVVDLSGFSGRGTAVAL